MDNPTEPDQQTRSTEEEDATRAHQADRPATSEEERSADEAVAQSNDEDRRRVAHHYEEMAEIGVEEKGEGRIE